MPKSPNERVRPQIGDVIEIDTDGGLAYAQYTHEHREPPVMGSLLRVLPGVFETRPSDFALLVEEEERFSVFFPLATALSRGILRIVANESVPVNKRAFPTFRSRTRDSELQGAWWYWDGRREWRESRWRRHRYRRRAIRSTWNDTLLIDRIASGWSPGEDDGG